MKKPQRRPRRIGLFGGKFDPLHYGHLLMAEWTREMRRLDMVDFVTSANPPNKASGYLDAQLRHDMVVAGTADNPNFRASRLDINHGGSGYSLLTVEAAKDMYPNDELFYISSSEYLNPRHKYYLPKWIGGKELFKLCTFLIFPRDKADAEQSRHWAAALPQVNIEVFEIPSPPLSSTLVRELNEQGRSIWYTTPWAVQQMIAKAPHYRLPDTPQLALFDPFKKPTRIGIFGGQFDPINYGELLAAEWLRQQYFHDRVEFITSANPPNNGEVFVSAEARHDMVVAATAENPYFIASRVDLDRHTKSYALLTVEQVREKYGSGVELDMILSSKYLDPENEWHLTNWMGTDRLFKMVRFLIIPRLFEDKKKVSRWAKSIKGANIEVTDAPPPVVTPEMIRSLVAQGRSIRYTTPWSVSNIITREGLYLPGNTRSHAR